MFDLKVERVVLSSLARQWNGVNPFTVLDTMGGGWLARKQEWERMGIKSELGRGKNLIGYSFTRAKFINWDRAKKFERSSIFNPVLCEIMYNWFCPKGGTILDPFAGGSVRGVVAAIAGFDYLGVDLRKEQIEANEEQWREIDAELGPFDKTPRWFHGDACELNQSLVGGLKGGADLIFTCPPYGDLEVYSEDPKDLSTMSGEDFDAQFAISIQRAYRMLKPGRFAIYTVGDYRDKEGFYRCFPELTVNAAVAAGFKKYNEVVLLNSPGSLPIRAGRVFKATRKLGKMHQNVLIFYKGQPTRDAVKRAVLAIGGTEGTEEDWNDQQECTGDE